MIKEYTKIRLKTGEIAHIVEVLKAGEAYIAEVIRPSNGFSVTIEDIKQDDITSVFEEIEHQLVKSA